MKLMFKRKKKLIGQIDLLMKSNTKYEKLFELQKRKIQESDDTLKAYIELSDEQYRQIRMLEQKNIELKQENKKLNSSKGGLIAEKNKLNKLVNELTKKLEDSMSDKYRVKKISSGRPHKGTPIKLKSNSKQSQIIKNVYKEIE